jgi:hypothetical protein
VGRVVGEFVEDELALAVKLDDERPLLADARRAAGAGASNVSSVGAGQLMLPLFVSPQQAHKLLVAL